MVNIYTIEIIFKSHEPFQSYLLTGLANSAKKAGFRPAQLADISERARGT